MTKEFLEQQLKESEQNITLDKIALFAVMQNEKSTDALISRASARLNTDLMQKDYYIKEIEKSIQEEQEELLKKEVEENEARAKAEAEADTRRKEAKRKLGLK